MKMKKAASSWLVALASLVLVPFSLMGKEREKPVDPNAPEIRHVPVTTAMRGVPVSLNATITSPVGAVLTSATVLVRLGEVGTPLSIPMTGEKGDAGAFSALVPVTMVRSVSVFWYALDARDDDGRIGGTLWYRVVIVEPYIEGGAAAAVGGAAGGGSGGNSGYLVGGLLLAGGATAIVLNEQDDDDDGGKPPPSPDTPNNPPPAGDDDDDDDEEPGVVSPPAPEEPACTITPTVTYNDASYCDSLTSPIEVVVCACPDKTVSVISSWGDVGVLVSTIEDCRYFNLSKAPGFPSPGSETITVYVGSDIVDTEPSPPADDFDCF